MTRIYLIRHAEAEGNLYRIAQGQHDSNLTDRGWRQVRALEKRFESVRVDAVYSSDLYRTCATASALYRPKNLPLQRRKDLREIYVGAWEQRTWGDIARTEAQAMDDFGSRMDRWKIPGAETPGEVLTRIRAAVEEIAAENPGRTVAVFCHGYAIRLLLANLQGYTLAETGGKQPTGDNTAVSLLEAENGTMRIVFQNDSQHLQTPEYLAGEKVRKRATALEPGLWFAPLTLPEHAGLLQEAAGAAWGEGGEARLLPSGADCAAMVGYLDEEPVGVLQLGPEPGRIFLAYIRAERRKRGFGVQLIGQAVQHTRAGGGERLWAALPPQSEAEPFFRDCGFHPAEQTAGGYMVFVKNIGFDREILGKS